VGNPGNVADRAGAGTRYDLAGGAQAALGSVIAWVNLTMLRDVLLNGPTWYQDYGLSGMQYGARQVFGAIQDALREDPQTEITLSANWSFSTHELARFFLKEPVPILIGSIENFIHKQQPLSPKSLLVLTPQEYQQALSSNRFSDIHTDKILYNPDGTPGFYMIRIRYVPNVDEIIARELEVQLQLQATEINLDDQVVQVVHSPLDMGLLEEVFDGDPTSMVRTQAANPAIFELVLPSARPIHGVEVLYGTTTIALTVSVYAEEEDPQPDIFSGRLDGTLDQPQTELNFGRPVTAQKIRLEVLDITQGQPGHVHLWEIRLW
jgi:hypothetical protein